MAHRSPTPRTLLGLLWRSFLATGGFVMTGLGLVAALVGQYFTKSFQVDVFWVAIAGTVVVIVLITAIHATSVAHAAALKRLPSVRIARKPPASYRGVSAVLLLEPSELFASDILVSIYHLEDEAYEAFVGIGRVTTIQDVGLIQVAVTHIAPEYDDLLARVLLNDRQALKGLIVKPNVPTSLYATFFGDMS